MCACMHVRMHACTHVCVCARANRHTVKTKTKHDCTKSSKPSGDTVTNGSTLLHSTSTAPVEFDSMSPVMTLSLQRTSTMCPPKLAIRRYRAEAQRSSATTRFMDLKKMAGLSCMLR